MNTTYPSNLSDAEWECLQQHLPSEPSRGRPRTHALREIFDAIFYILRDFLCVALFALQFPALANGVLPFSTFAPQRNLVSPAHCPSNCRTRACGQERTTECSDHRCDIRVKTVEESASICGFDAHKHVKGRKRHILVDTPGLLLAVYVTPADLHDSKGAKCLLAGLAPLLPRLKKIWADGAYRGQELAAWCSAEGDWDLEVVERTPGVRGFSVQPKRWVVERTFGWLSRNRRMSKDYERKVQTSETFIEVAMIRLLVARLGGGRDVFPATDSSGLISAPILPMHLLPP